VSSRVPIRLWITKGRPTTKLGCPILATPLSLWLGWDAILLLALALPISALCQYPGQITNPDKNTPQLRAVAVLEWTGDKDHPKATRLIPVSIFDGKDLEDAGEYMARPEPLALEGEVEYQLQLDGKPIGLFDVESSGEQQGSWVGFGKWKALPAPKAPQMQMAKVDEDDAQSDVPVLHRKHPAGGSGSGNGSDAGSSSNSGSSATPPDPDRPTLHKSGDASASGSSDSSNGSGSTSGNSSNTSGSSNSSQVDDPDRPTLHKGGDAAGSGTGSNSSSSGPPPDPDRPTMQRSDSSTNSSGQSKKKKSDEDEGYVEDVATVTDPERPRLFRGKAEGYSGPALPSLTGLPADMQQVVAVSDLKSQPVHPWDYTWANPDDADKMRAAMEDIARDALGLNPPPAPPAKQPASKTATTHKSAKPAPPPPAPAPLIDEQFRIFELAYSSGATMVLSARTAGANGPVKFVTLVAQPDLYGNVTVLVKNVTDASHLDESPRMRLVDAVDALADNRGELLFELRGASQRQFALYRVLRGQATRIFLSGGEAIGAPAGE
jgi:hypothetical protein